MRSPAMRLLTLALAALAAVAHAGDIIPRPVTVAPLMDAPATVLTVAKVEAPAAFKAEADLIRSAFAAPGGATVIRLVKVDAPVKGFETGDEGYVIETLPGQPIVISSRTAAGAFYAYQTLLQAAYAGNDGKRYLAPGVIMDKPRFAWRGLMLDEGRHFFGKEKVKRFLDLMAMHKLNVFHWHLTDDQGWRIEIKKYPKLTEVGAFRDSTPPYGNRNSDDKQRYGGFYTQEQVKELVAYASARHITIVPEIELPGHAAAAIAAYPQFGNTDVPGYNPKVMTRWGVHPYVFAPKEETFAFLEDVLTEVCELFPSKFIHIGGDEAPKSQWNQSKFAKEVMQREGLKNADELQSYFIRRIEKFLASKNRSLVGWDEIQEGGLPKSATMMVWRDLNWARHALDLGNNVVMAPNAFAYLDHYQRPASEELSKGPEYEAIGGFLPVSKLYGYDPASVARNDKERKQILGVQAQLWTEYMKDWKKVEYMAFPRIAALAEIAWLPKEKKNYEDFRERLDGVMKFYDALGINRAVPLDPPKKETKDGSVIETSLNVHADHAIEFAYDGRADTFFWAGRELKKDDHITLRLKTPLTQETTVTVQTGGKASQNGDRLEKGELQYSLDGSTWIKVADFSEGKATGPIPAQSKALRVLVTAPQKFWLIVHEIVIE